MFYLKVLPLHFLEGFVIRHLADETSHFSAEVFLELRDVVLVSSTAIVQSCSDEDHLVRYRPLPSVGITRFHRYYGPLRHPKRPGPTLASCQLIPYCDHRWGFPCCVWSPFVCMPSPLPRQDR